MDSARAFLPEAVLPAGQAAARRFGLAPQRAPWFSERLRQFEQASSDKPVKLPLDFHSVHARSIYLEARSKYHIHCMEWNNKAAALNGITCAFPFLDRDLVQFLMAVPGDIQNAGGVPRAMARDGMRGVLPDEIRARVWKGDPSALHEFWSARGGRRVHQRSQSATRWRHEWGSWTALSSGHMSKGCWRPRACTGAKTAGEWQTSLAWRPGFGYSLQAGAWAALGSGPRANNRRIPPG